MGVIVTYSRLSAGIYDYKPVFSRSEIYSVIKANAMKQQKEFRPRIVCFASREDSRRV
jgi:hypothetical protein